MIKELLPVFQLAVSICTLLGMLYAFKKFIERPHDSLESRVIALEIKQKVFINCMLAFIDFELSYCSHTDYKYTEDLDKAKDTLRKHLAKARG